MPWLQCVVSNVLLALLLALAALFVQWWLRRHAIAHILWVLVLVKLVTPPLVSVPFGKSPGSVACTLGTCGCDHHSRTTTFVRDTLPWLLLAAWSVGAGTTTWTAVCRWTHFRRLTANASLAPPEWQALAARLTSELSMPRPPLILAVPGRLPPLIVPGRPRPRMLLPITLMGRLPASQRVALLVHELVHIKRRDHWVRMLELTIRVVYWWLPFVSSISQQLRACEEACCDAAVVAHLPEARRDYAELLLDVLDFADAPSGNAVQQATAMSAASHLEQRLRTILHATQGTRFAWPVGAVTLGFACAVLPWQVRWDVVPRPARKASELTCEPKAGVVRLSRDTCGGEPSGVLRCPS
jgi:bla regulator protein blaR1